MGAKLAKGQEEDGQPMQRATHTHTRIIIASRGAEGGGAPVKKRS
jgi:hypothetical protein